MATESISDQQRQLIKVEVVYALADRQSLLCIEVDAECTAIEAVRYSGITQLFPEIDLSKLRLGIFSNECSNEQALKSGDRIEIYRPLSADPKEIRKRRAAEMAKKKLKKAG